MLPITQNLSTGYNISSRGHYNPEWIVIHYFGSLGTALACSNYFKTGNRNASADFFVDDETIIQFNPDIKTNYTWHCGGGLQGSIRHSKYGICKNCNSIGIEMRPYNNRGNVSAAQNAGWYFHRQTVDNAIDLVQYLMDKYRIDADHVIMHADVTGKYCPAPFLDDISQWEDFKNRISSKNTNENSSETITPDFKPYIVAVTTDVLNIRKRPTTSSDIVMTIGQNEKYTIVEESSDGQWGRLKSGAGWIYLQYTKKAMDAEIHEPEDKPTDKYPMLVKITAKVLNVRQGPGTNFPVVTTVKYGEIYTILSETNGFGQLKSGIGYISMEYTKRV